jgi:hypothetical protein
LTPVNTTTCRLSPIHRAAVATTSMTREHTCGTGGSVRGMSADGRSSGGSEIYRHQAVAPTTDDVAHADDERISAHLERLFGEPGMVWHEIVSDRVHVDVHVVPASRTRKYITLVTSGMSALPMTVPAALDEREKWMHAELCLLLPATWKIEQEALSDERNFWPIRLLKGLARLPHDFATWLGLGHSIPNGDPAEPYADGTELAGAIIIPPLDLVEGFFEVPGEPPMHIFQVLPVTPKEMDFKLAHGHVALLERMEQHDATIFGPIDPRRRSAV